MCLCGCVLLLACLCVWVQRGSLQGSAAVFASVCVCGNPCKPTSCYCNKTSQFLSVSQASFFLTRPLPQLNPETSLLPLSWVFLRRDATQYFRSEAGVYVHKRPGVMKARWHTNWGRVSFIDQDKETTQSKHSGNYAVLPLFVCNVWLRWKEIASWRSHLVYNSSHTHHTCINVHIHTPVSSILPAEVSLTGWTGCS